MTDNTNNLKVFPQSVYPTKYSLPRHEAVEITHEIISRCEYLLLYFLENDLADKYQILKERTHDDYSFKHKGETYYTSLKITLEDKKVPNHPYTISFNNLDLNEAVEFTLVHNDQKLVEGDLELEECCLAHLRSCVENIVRHLK